MVVVHARIRTFFSLWIRKRDLTDNRHQIPRRWLSRCQHWVALSFAPATTSLRKRHFDATRPGLQIEYGGRFVCLGQGTRLTAGARRGTDGLRACRVKHALWR